MSGTPQSPDQRWDALVSRVEIDTAGCWSWQGRALPNGYVEFSLDGKRTYAHRAAYTLANGPIPDGLHIDHLCRNRACVNPAHLEPVTQLENNRRAAAARTECPQGHPLDGLRRNGANVNRYCKTCNRARAAARYRAGKKAS